VEFVLGCRVSEASHPQSQDAGHGEVNHARELVCEITWTVLAEPPFRFFGGKPRRIPIRFFRLFEPHYLTEMRADRALFVRGLGRGIPLVWGLPPNILDERSFFYPAMNSRLFEGFEGGGLGVGQARFSVALGESPMSAVGSNQQELDATLVDPVANGSDLFASPQLAKL
jgi:hypothetical protein